MIAARYHPCVGIRHMFSVYNKIIFQSVHPLGNPLSLDYNRKDILNARGSHRFHRNLLFLPMLIQTQLAAGHSLAPKGGLYLVLTYI